MISIFTDTFFYLCSATEGKLQIKTMKQINKILIIRFRQIGDSILATSLCSTLKATFPEAEIHFLLNANIAPLYQGHPHIDKIITYDKNDNKPFISYLRKTWQTMHQNKYDVIIDMRSTIRTLFFSLFSLRTPFRIGYKKKYTHFLLSHSIDIKEKRRTLDMVQQDLLLAQPLSALKEIQYTNKFSLFLTEEEKMNFRNYMEHEGIDFNKPVVLIGVTTKLAHKMWNKEYMKDVLNRILTIHENLQLIFNYAPGHEENEAKEMYEELGRHKNIKINIQASSLRELAALCSNCSFYFGNEGGTRHMVQALQIPSFAIYSPSASKKTWLPANSVTASGICVDDVLSKEEQKNKSKEECYNAITPDKVFQQLNDMLKRL